jgi:hypothetical protein
MDGNFPTSDNMSVWEFNGRFQSNMGHGIFVTATCPLRQADMWIYSEDNFNGASASGLTTDGAVDFGSVRASRIWAYVEQQTVGLELVLRAASAGNTVQSSRANADSDFSGANLWFWSNGLLTNPSSSAIRTVTLPGFRGLATRIGTSGDYLRLPMQGSGGSFGSIEGAGVTGGGQKLRLLASDTTTAIGVYAGAMESNAPAEYYGQSLNRQVVNFGIVAPVGNQVKIVANVSDIVARQGTGLLEIFLSANTDTDTSRRYHKSFLAFSSRNGTASSVWDTAETVQASSGFTLASVTVSGLQATLLYTLDASIIGVSGYVQCHGGVGHMTSATLSAP